MKLEHCLSQQPRSQAEVLVDQFFEANFLIFTRKMPTAFPTPLSTKYC